MLKEILATKAEEVSRLRPERAALRSAARGMPPTRGFAAALRGPGEVRLLAEVKRRSPSAGAIRPGSDPAEVAAWYRDAGAAALSVLTDRHYFDGSLEALRSVRSAVELPILRKDFIVDPVQIWEARAAGADAVLLIVAALEDGRLADLQAEAIACGLDVLVEVHDGGELDRALGAGARLIGINNRDLRTFTTDLGTTHALAPRVAPELTLVAESGIRSSEDVDALGAAGVDAVLVGESLMRQPDVRAAAAALVGRPKSAGRGG